MEFLIWVETRLDGRILGTGAGIQCGAACIRNRARRDRPEAGGRQARASKSTSSDCPESGHLAPPSPSAFGDLTGNSVPLRYLGQQSAVSSGSRGARRTTSHLLIGAYHTLPCVAMHSQWVTNSISGSLSRTSTTGLSQGANPLHRHETLALRSMEPMCEPTE
jgi:hypothetical protein